MFNCFKKILTEGSRNKQSLNSCFCSLITAFVLVSGAINIARAEVCFLPDGQGCEQVPYEEYGRVPNPTYPKDCFATKEEAMNARTDSLDSYYQNGNMWCIKSSCSASLYDSNYKGGNWLCYKCHDANSTRANFYNCTCPLTAKSGYEIDYNICAYVMSQCTGSATTSCETSECQTCEGTGQYSGGNECKIPTPVKAHCPKGYVPEEPNTKCYSTQDMICGEGTCYKAVDAPECGEGKHLAKANGVCSCVDDESNQDYTPCDNGIWYAGNCVRYFHLRMDSDLHCYKSVYSKNIKVDGNAAHISDIDADWAVIPEGTMVTVDFEMLDQYKDLYSEDVCKNNGMIMIGHNYLTGSELDLNSKLTVFLAQSKISFIADDSHFNYVDTIPWNNDRDEILLDLYDNDYPDSGTSSIPEVTICLEEFFDGDQGEVGDGYVLCGYSLTRYVDEDNSGDFEKLLAAGYSFDLNLNIGNIGYWVDGKHYFDNNVYGYYCDFVLTKARVGCLNNTVGWPCLEDYAHSNNRSKDCDENPELCYGCGSSYLCYGSNNFPTDFPSLQSTGTYLEITGPDVSKSLNLGACHHIPSQNVNVCFELY